MQTLDLVIVTYNRLEKLKKTLQHYEAQTHPFRNLIVVNNCSTDGTKEYLTEWAQKPELNSSDSKFHHILIHVEDNLGGSGGFYLGEKKAMELKADWVFVADDDAYADPTMVEEFYRYIDSHDTTHTSAVCAEVLNLDGSICMDHRTRHKVQNCEFSKTMVSVEEYQKESFPIDGLSYVGSFMNAKTLNAVGLVNPQYFIYNDDAEHSMRLRKWGDIFVVPSIRILHESGQMSDTKDGIVTWREYYAHRNFTHMMLHHYPFIALGILICIFKTSISMILYGQKTDARGQLYRKAVWDAFLGNLGKDKMYKPGWNADI